MREANQRRGGVGRTAGLVYVLALLMSVVVCGVFSYWETQRQREFAQAADKFGYLQMAQDIRRGSAPGGGPRFTVDSEHVRLFLGFLKERGVKLEGEYGPGVYHYASGTKELISPYPPGVGIMLSVFPEGRAVFAWQVMTVAGFVGLAGWGCVWGLRRGTIGAYFAAGMMCLAAQYGVLSLGVAVSYSVDLSWVPLMAAVGAGFVGRSRGGWIGAVLVIAAGAALGWATVVRLSNGAFLIGFLALMMGCGWKRSAVRAAVFTAGFFVAGIGPLMVHQAAMTGSAFQSTYLPKDAAAPSLEFVAGNARYYFAGEGSGMLWIFLAGVAGFGLWLAAGARGLAVENKVGGEMLGGLSCSDSASEGGGAPLSRAHGDLGWMGAAVGLWWALPTGYFLMHRITTPYYQFPTMMVSLAGMAWMMRVMEASEGGAARWRKGILVAGAVVVAGMAVFLAADLPALSDSKSAAMPDVTLPAALEDPKAWILADRLGGALWYYHGIAAQGIVGLDGETRAAFYRFVRGRGEPLYVIVDNAAMKDLGMEMMGKGAKLTEVGTFCDSQEPDEKGRGYVRVYRVEWGGIENGK